MRYYIPPKAKAQSVDFDSGKNGSISGYFATFHHDHGDSYGDVIRKGAFLGTIERRKKTGHPFPLCLNHDFSCIIGKVTDIHEDYTGAHFTAEFFPTERAQEIRETVKSGVLWQFSFAYDVLKAKKIKAEDGSTVNELQELELYEISVVLVPANSRATITDVKSGNEHTLLTPEQITQRAEALDLIKQADEEERARKAEQGRLLRYIRALNNETTEGKIKNLKAMEERILRDIGIREVEGDEKGKQLRIGALESVRKELKRLESSL